MIIKTAIFFLKGFDFICDTFNKIKSISLVSKTTSKEHPNSRYVKPKTYYA